MDNITVFQFESQEVRFVGTPEDPWWVAADICAVLEIKNPSQAIDRLDSDDRAMLNIGINVDVWCVNESGLYTLILGSRKNATRRFKKWVTSEVLPSIRKTGKYEVKEQNNASVELISQAIDAVFGGTQIPPNLVAGVKANAIAKQYPQLSAAMEEAKKSLPVATEQQLLTVTELSALYAERTNTQQLSAIKFNNLLADRGLQKKNPEGKPNWLPIGQGNEFGQMVLETAKGRDKTIQSLKWYPSVVDFLVGGV